MHTYRRAHTYPHWNTRTGRLVCTHTSTRTHVYTAMLCISVCLQHTKPHTHMCTYGHSWCANRWIPTGTLTYKHTHTLPMHIHSHTLAHTHRGIHCIHLCAELWAHTCFIQMCTHTSAPAVLGHSRLLKTSMPHPGDSSGQVGDKWVLCQTLRLLAERQEPTGAMCHPEAHMTLSSM